VSCYKDLMIENEYIRHQLSELTSLTNDIQEQIADEAWVSAEEIRYLLDNLPIEEL